VAGDNFTGMGGDGIKVLWGWAGMEVNLDGDGNEICGDEW